jgi:hypothetical protein
MGNEASADEQDDNTNIKLMGIWVWHIIAPPDPRVVFRPELRMSTNESETQTVDLSHCGD